MIYTYSKTNPKYITKSAEEYANMQGQLRENKEDLRIAHLKDLLTRYTNYTPEAEHKARREGASTGLMVGGAAGALTGGTAGFLSSRAKRKAAVSEARNKVTRGVINKIRNVVDRDRVKNAEKSAKKSISVLKSTLTGAGLGAGIGAVVGQDAGDSIGGILHNNRVIRNVKNFEDSKYGQELRALLDKKRERSKK